MQMAIAWLRPRTVMRARSCNDESIAVLKIGEQGLLSNAGRAVSSVRQRGMRLERT